MDSFKKHQFSIIFLFNVCNIRFDILYFTNLMSDPYSATPKTYKTILFNENIDFLTIFYLIFDILYSHCFNPLRTNIAAQATSHFYSAKPFRNLLPNPFEKRFVYRLMQNGQKSILFIPIYSASIQSINSKESDLGLI